MFETGAEVSDAGKTFVFDTLNRKVFNALVGKSAKDTTDVMCGKSSRTTDNDTASNTVALRTKLKVLSGSAKVKKASENGD